MEKIIYLVRHAHMETNGKMIGSLDLPLSEKGKIQANVLKEELEEGIKRAEFYKNKASCHINDLTTCFQSIYVSPLLRATQTAEILLYTPLKPLTLFYTITKEFEEINLGDWEGMKKTEIIQKFPDIWLKRGLDFTSIAPPNGENFKQLQKRVLKAFYTILENMKGELPVLIVAHQAVNRVILGHVKGINLEDINSIPQEYASVTIITMQD